jgi:hypothetical protein
MNKKRWKKLLNGPVFSSIPQINRKNRGLHVVKGQKDLSTYGHSILIDFYDNKKITRSEEILKIKIIFHQNVNEITILALTVYKITVISFHICE